jgi:STE24 endopeptidase
MLVGSVLEFFIEPLMNLWSRTHEWQADAFAMRHVPHGDLQTALIKLAKDNLANLHVHPLYVAYHASHPTLPARVAKLRDSLNASEH